ncbi:MAG: hypothetical protein RJA22_3124 [Verrucomicrobiota bacterium]
MRRPFPTRFALLLACLPGAILPASAQPADAPASGQTNTPAPAIRTLASGLLAVGGTRVDPRLRTVTVPAFVNLQEGIVEYVLVHSSGKTHESLLRTDVGAREIHVAMLLLGATGAGTNALPLDPAETLPGDTVTVDIRWTEGRRARSVAAEEVVYDRRLGSALRRGRWTYTGSRLREDGFGAQVDGSIISLITDPDALVNNPRRGREDDDNWLAKARRLPEFNHPVDVVITLLPPASRPAPGTGPRAPRR